MGCQLQCENHPIPGKAERSVRVCRAWAVMLIAFHGHSGGLGTNSSENASQQWITMFVNLASKGLAPLKV